ncbi:Cytochrome c oxidase polypeptide II [hydrothermal vent metagenome]|uniref:cytochrome-c oxidase n=1 Tax=hydrothermal vent metagenome TaxID=652676 RepID=A0A3B0VEX4_9ZZZZ
MNKTTKSCKRGRSGFVFTIFILLSLAVSSLAHAEYGLNLTKGVTDFSNEVFGLHMVILWICVAIAVLVFGVMIYSMFAHRKSRGVTAAQFSHSTKAEIIWTIIPIIILVVIAIPSTTALINMEYPTDENGDKLKMEMTIKVTGYQWKWKYDYLGEGVSFLSTLASDSNEARQLGSGINPIDVENYLLDVDNPLVIPVDTNIRFLLTADDVIHSWWVPAFGWKRDTIPGFVNEAWTNVKKVGTYRGQCAELCGKDHGFMPVVVIVKSKADYASWLQDQKGQQDIAAAKNNTKWTQADLISTGKKVYDTQCATCHQTSGAGIEPTFPALDGSVMVNGPMDEQIKVVVFGKAGTAMAAYGGMLSESDIAAAITYTRNAWSNTAKDAVQPQDIKRIKNN